MVHGSPHYTTVTARIAAFCMKGVSCELRAESRVESNNGRVRGRGRTLYKQALRLEFGHLTL